MSLNLIVGHLGLLCLCSAAFFAIGAYGVGMLNVLFGISLIVSIILSLLVGALFGVIVGVISFRVRNEYFAVTTFSIQVIFYSLLNNLTEFTGGPMGISNIPEIHVNCLNLRSPLSYVIFAIILCVLCFMLYRRMSQNGFGRLMSVIRDDEIYAISLAKNVKGTKIVVIIFSGVIITLAGSVYATYVGFIAPVSFNTMQSIMFLSMVLVGGVANTAGAFVGAVIVTLAPEVFRYLGLPTTAAANLREIMYGMALIIVLVWKPRGILGKISFGSERTIE